MPQPQTQKAFDACNCEAFCSCTLSSPTRLGLEGLGEPEGGGEVTLGREEGQREEGGAADPGRGSGGSALAPGSMRKGMRDWRGGEGGRASARAGSGARRPLDDPSGDQLTPTRGGGRPSQRAWKLRLPGWLSPACPCGSLGCAGRGCPHLPGAPARRAHAQEGGPGAERSRSPLESAGSPAAEQGLSGRRGPQVTPRASRAVARHLPAGRPSAPRCARTAPRSRPTAGPLQV